MDKYDTENSTTESLIMFIEREWADMHHSRLQEWTALGVVTGAHLGLIQFLKYLKDVKLDSLFIIEFLCLVGIIFAVIGALITCRHRAIMHKKFNWIYKAEEQLGLVKNEDHPNGIISFSDKMPEHKGDLMLPKLLSVSGLILCFYILIMVIDIIIFRVHFSKLI